MRLRLIFLLTAALTAPLCAWQESADLRAGLRAGGSTYFTAKIENLTRQLNLSHEQVAKLKPIAEQEVGYLNEIHGNSVLSRKQKLKRLEEIVRNSDAQMKPMLSADQWQKLQSMRKQQKEELKKFAEQTNTSAGS